MFAKHEILIPSIPSHELEKKWSFKVIGYLTFSLGPIAMVGQYKAIISFYWGVL
jgi:hypothetical protein